MTQGFGFDHLVAVDLKAPNQSAEGGLGAQGLGVQYLAGERQGRLLAEDDVRVTAGYRQQVGAVQHEAIDHAQLAVTQDRRAVTCQAGIFQIRLLDHPAGPSRKNDETIRFRNVLLVQDRPAVHDVIEDVGLIQRKRGTGGTQVVPGRYRAGRRACIAGMCIGVDITQNLSVDRDLQLLGRIARPVIDKVVIGLKLVDVLDDKLPRVGPSFRMARTISSPSMRGRAL